VLLGRRYAAPITSTLDVIEMLVRRVAIALLVVAPSLACLTTDAAAQNLRLTASQDLGVPKIDDLRTKLEQTLRQPSSAKTYVLESGRLVEVKPPPLPRGVVAVVRSYSDKERVARIEVSYPRYRMPLIQIWSFDGRNWSDSVDPGIIVGR
jgi:hypothetical protein